jgi:hypothetical protein
MHDLPPYEDRCALLYLDTLAKGRSITCVMFIFDFLSGRVNSPNLLSILDLINPRYPTRGTEFLRMYVCCLFNNIEFRANPPLYTILK